MDYPKTPRSLWLHVKVSPQMASGIKKLRRSGSTYEEIGKQFEVSRETARIYANDISRRPSRRRKVPTPEQKRKAYLRKKEILGDELREYRKSLYK